MSYGLPQELHKHVDMVHPTASFPSTRTMIIAASKSTTESRQAKKLKREMAHGHHPKPLNPSPGLDIASCNITVTPDCVKALYVFVDFHPPTTFSNKFSIAGYLEEYVRDDDLVIFEEIYANQTTGTLYDFVSVNGDLNTQYWAKTPSDTPSIFNTTLL
jgi:tripeptidyl-peptidase-1